MNEGLKTRSARAMAGAAAAFALSIAGCGGGDSTTDTTQGTPLSSADFIAQADAICAQGTKDLDQVQQDFASSQPTQAEAEAFVTDEVVPNLEQQANEIDALGPPDEDVDQINAIVDALRSGIESLEEDPNLLLTGENTAFDEANELALDYGLEDCGNGN